MDYYKKSKEEIFKEFNTNYSGLNNNFISQAEKKYGKNIIKKTNKLEPIKIFFEQFRSFLIYILFAAAVISFLIKDNLEGMVICAVILVNAIIGFYQQYKAEKSINNLKKLLIPYAKVIRNGRLKKIKSNNLVPGDLVVFETGDKVSADCRIIEAQNLQTNEAVLTGESFPISKHSKILHLDTSLAERKNMLYSGTQIVSGKAKAIVVATGSYSEFGKIAHTVQSIAQTKTPIQKRLDVFSKKVGIFILALVSLIVILGLTEYFDLAQMFKTAASLAVSAIPSGLPAVLSISFAIASVFMAKRNVVVRKLPAVETLGSVNVICTDKTGTLTEEKMQIQKLFSNNKEFDLKNKQIFFRNKKIYIKKNKQLSHLLKISLLCNNSKFEEIEGKYEFIGDPTESTLVALGLDLGFNKKVLSAKEPRIKEFEFDSERKMMSVLRDSGINNTLYSKGAPEKILKLCKQELRDGQIKRLTEKRKNELLNSSKNLESEALRVLGFAYKNFSKKSNAEEKGLIFVGFAGMIDPPRKEVKSAISQCLKAGISIKMITGDSAVTAEAISKQIGIKGEIVLGSDLDQMSDSELLREIDNIGVFARATPQQKLRIAKTLQAKDNIVAITGDGVNDVLALKSADIGVAMGIRGTDVARDVSDVVLLDDNFASIVQGVRQGRKTYDNIKKFTKYLLAVNFSEIFLIGIALILAMIFGEETWFLPLLPLQILWINLITDTLPSITLSLEKEENVMKSKPRNEKNILEGIWKFIIVAGTFTLLAKFTAYLFGIYYGFSPERTQTIVLTTAVIYEMFFVYTCRSDKPLFQIGIFSNKWLNYAVLTSLFLHLILIYTKLGEFFGVIPLTELADWILIIILSISGVVFFEIRKYFKKMKK